MGEIDGGASGAQPEDAGVEQAAQTFTQEQVNELVGKARTEERRKAQTKYADYDTLKAKADGAKTLEDRFAEMERATAEATARAMRSDIAAAHGISVEDRDLFLTGADEETLTAQAKRLAERIADRKKQGNVAPREGGNHQPKADGEREAVRSLFGSG